VESRIHQTSFTVYNSKKELPPDDLSLMQAAEKAIAGSYAPYSHFHVGAAVLLANGKVVTGNNQENAAYPSGMCAERVAIWSAASQYPQERVLKIAITVHAEMKQVKTPVAPCGACRQTLLEYEVKQKEPIEIFFAGEIGKVVKAHSLKDLLPFAFDQSFL
jgi:cytidine deaminase